MARIEQQRQRDLVRLEGDATEPVLSHIVDPCEKITHDLARLEGDPSDPLPSHYLDPTDKIWTRDAGGIEVKGPRFSAISSTFTFTAVSTVAKFILGLDPYVAAVVGLLASFGGNVTIYAARRTARRAQQLPPYQDQAK